MHRVLQISFVGAILVAALMGPAAAARAQGAALVACPPGAVETDITLAFHSVDCEPDPACTFFHNCNCWIGSTCGEGGRLAGNGGPCDDGSWRYDVFRTEIWGTGAWGDGFPFASKRWDSIWINVNGTLSFGGPVSAFTPAALPGLQLPAIAPYLADVDLTTRPSDGDNPGRVLLCEDPGNERIMVTWLDVGYYNASYPPDRLNSFQVILRDEGEVCVDLELGPVQGVSIEYRYGALGWYAGVASGALPDGTCAENDSVEEGGSCVPAVVGFDTGDGTNSFQVEGTRERFVNEVLLSGAGGEEPGVYRFMLLSGSSLPAFCGDGVVGLCESCDDGELNGLTCCRADCTPAQELELCGDGGGECVVQSAPDPALVCECLPGFEPDGAECIWIVPTAHAGADQAVNGLSAVTLDAGGSTDPRGGALTYSWVQQDGPSVALANAGAAAPDFIAPAGPGTLIFEVTVCNEVPLCDTDTVVITVTGWPVARAGPDQTVVELSMVALDGSASSDPQHGALTYLWTQTDGPPVDLLGADGANPTFQAPGGAAVLEFTLEVCNASELCDADTVRVTLTCRPGWVAEGSACADLDECADAALNDCDPLAGCTNTAGSYTCGACPAGYADVGGDGTQCADIDECADASLNDCDGNATCTDTPGGYSCTCGEGFEGDGFVCTEVAPVLPIDNSGAGCGCTSGGTVSGGSVAGWSLVPILAGLALLRGRRRARQG